MVLGPRLTATLAVALAASAAADSVLSVNSAWLVDASAGVWDDIVAGPDPVSLALRDLRRDWTKVVGVPPSRVSALPTGKWDGDVVIVFTMAPAGAAPAESFTVVAAAAGGASSAPTLTVTGADVRGLIYGIYHVSQDFLGVDPFWWFNDAAPVYEPAGVAVSAAYSYSSGAPAFYSRGAFNNDEDLSGYFFGSPLGDSVFHSDFADKFCEALLRLRANTWIPSTFAYIDEVPYKVAAKRGLILGNHHVMPLGNNVFAWPKGVAYAYRVNPEPFQAAWRSVTDYAQNQQGREMVYSLGYRGVNDEPFWNEDVFCNTDECRGATITQAIANQSAIIDAMPFAIRPRKVAYLWMELLELKEAGTLVLPPDVACTWTDFPGSFLFSGGFDNVTAGHGFYGHIMMMNGRGGQLVEFVPPARIFANVYQFYVRNATAYGMINLSDLKYVPATAEAVYRYMWSPPSFNATPACAAASAAVPGAPAAALARDAATGRRGHVGAWPLARPGYKGCAARDFGGVTPAAAQAAFLLEFSTRHYGAAAGPAAAALYGQYFNISYMADAVPGVATIADQYLGSRLRDLIGAVESKDTSVAAECAGVAAANLPFVSALLNDGVLPLAASVPAGAPLRFFQSHLLAQTSIHYAHLTAFAAGAAAVYARVAGNDAAAAGNLTLALAAMDGLLDALRTAEGAGVWHGSLAADGWTWCWGSRQVIAARLAALQGKVLAPVPANPYPDYAFMVYESANANEPVGTPTFPLAGFNASIAWDAVPRFACAGDIPPARAAAPAAPGGGAPPCLSTWVGVNITGTVNVGFFTAAYGGPGARTTPYTVHFTMDGSEPTPASAAYTAPFAVSASATVRARSFDDATGSALGPAATSLVTLN